jgi:hypothetical protein
MFWAVVAAGARIFQIPRNFFITPLFLLRATELRRFNKLRSSGGLKKSAELQMAPYSQCHWQRFSPNYQRR